MKLHSMSFCFNIFSFHVPIEINKNTANAYDYYEIITNNTMYIVQELQIFS